MSTTKLHDLDTWDSESGGLNVIIETAKGSRNKFEYEPQTGSFALSKVLPRGMAFPYDFGFIPSTLADDGDPLDVLVLMDEPAFAGCRICCRVIGVIEGEDEENGKAVRNDRLIAVAEECHDHCHIHSFKDLNDQLLDQIEHFFVTCHDLDGKTFKPIGRHGPTRAEKLVKEARKRFRKDSPDWEAAITNGKSG